MGLNLYRGFESLRLRHQVFISMRRLITLFIKRLCFMRVFRVLLGVDLLLCYSLFITDYRS